MRYGAHVAVDSVSFAVRRGEVYGLLGPNGAGKTSVIRALTTIVPIDSGTVRIAGHGLDDPTAVRAAIGVLPESNGYPGAQTARGYLRFHGQLFGMSAAVAEQRADVLLATLGLPSDGRRIATYSRGMRQRLGLCRALINRPSVLFLDEPTLGLDPAGQDDVMRTFARLAVEDNTTIILCSHLLDEVERVCDRVAVMDRGELVATGTVDQVIVAADLADSNARLSDAFLALTAPMKEGVR